MNKQGKDGIEYLDYTFNPVTGCNHPCKNKYCYASKIAKRFGGNMEHEYHGLHILDRPMYKRTKNGKLMADPYPYGFEPTFHKYRLDEPVHIKNPSIVGVVYMGDLFGDWVPDEWIQEVFKACEAAPQHTYLFLTKNYKRASDYRYRDNWWIGKTITNNDNSRLCEGDPWSIDEIHRANQFLSIEPIQGDINELEYYLYSFKWVIIGAETGNRKGKVIPKKRWVDNIVAVCKEAGVPVFMKNSLKDIMGDDFLQKWPEGLK